MLLAVWLTTVLRQQVLKDLRLNIDYKKISLLYLYSKVLTLILLTTIYFYTDCRYVVLCVTVLNWFSPYLSGRDDVVSLGEHSSATINISFGVPQGSILGPLLFRLYRLLLFNRSGHGICYGYGDDIQLYIFIYHGWLINKFYCWVCNNLCNSSQTFSSIWTEIRLNLPLEDQCNILCVWHKSPCWQSWLTVFANNSLNVVHINCRKIKH